MSELFLDTNVFLDVILERTNDFKDAEEIIELSGSGNINISTSPSCLITVIYFLGKAGLTKEAISEIIIHLLKTTSLTPTDKRTFSVAMKSDFSDLEDAVQYFTALSAGNIDYFITSNTKDYKKALAELPVLTPKQFVNLYNRSKSG